MSGEVVFAALYATAVVAAAMGIDWAGERSARRRPGAAHEVTAAWPHTGSIAVHSVVAGVAAAAGLLVAVVMGARHPHAGDWLVLAVPCLLAVAALVRIAARVRVSIDA